MKWRLNIVKFVNTSIRLAGIIMKFQTGQNHDMNASIICDIGIMKIIDDLVSDQQAILNEEGMRIVQVFMGIILVKSDEMKFSMIELSLLNRLSMDFGLFLYQLKILEKK